jgi:anti-sigma regulatory factor (Ser/Thr protein kinase)
MTDFLREPDVELGVTARPENVAVVRHALSGLADALEIDEDVMADINLAVSEACANVVIHAYDGGEGPLEVAAGVDDGRLTVVVRDRGRGIAPRPDSPGLGVGLPLMATLSDTLELREGVDRATEVWMTFSLRPGAQKAVEGAIAQ